MASNSNTANKDADKKATAPLTPKEMGRKGDFLDKLTGSFNFFYHTIPEKAKAAKQKIKELKEGPKSRPDPRLAGLGRPHENYDMPDRDQSLESVREGPQ
ncbi:hypothetical protein CKM354_000526400 [Cercospora kikuchii]|uniref:Uncharacterized protein n=1 Tax=Cercospora kikuchii TaxID=84275 RepID=A0A9P3CP84_9PEZI|nr:uncharacterized protein CKM354_000526400 [Cercospora kikuchii]GIZ41983.1 hypothetical protein CKM354_000526400 [Cercospora kikuchii]